MSTLRHALTVFGSILGCALANAAQADGTGLETVTIHVHRPAAAGARPDLQRRIAAAAREACGASPFSAPGVKEAVARSACWHDSYAAGIAQIDGAARSTFAANPAARGRGKP